MDFDEAAARLYAAPAAGFVAQRNELARQLKAGGDQLGSSRLKALRRPSVAAWVVNLLARERPDGVDDLLALGDEFRTATADQDGGRLRELTPRRHQMIDQLIQVAGALAAEHGQKLSADVTQKVRETLDAALVDPAAGDAVRAGRLGSALRHVGFGVVDENGEPSTVVPITDERRRRAQERRRAATGGDQAADHPDDEAEREAEDRRAAARQALEQAVGAAETAEAAVEDLDRRLSRAQDALEQARADVRELTGELEQARKAARDAQRASREARKRFNRL